jgi:hypothetical protein
VDGDRKIEIVLIGLEMNREDVEESLDHCLLTEEEMLSDWSTIPDPLPAFF